MRLSVVLLGLTAVVVVAMVTIVPLGDVTYSCRSTYSLLREPAEEFGEAFPFFDDGRACNAAARQRAIGAAIVAGAGTVAAVGAAVRQRRRASTPSAVSSAVDSPQSR